MATLSGGDEAAGPRDQLGMVVSFSMHRFSPRYFWRALLMKASGSKSLFLFAALVA